MAKIDDVANEPFVVVLSGRECVMTAACITNYLERGTTLEVAEILAGVIDKIDEVVQQM